MSRLLLLITFMTMLLGSCSNLSQNMTKQGELQFSGGVYKERSWDDEMIFQRLSWYKEMTLVSDILLHNVDEKSPFYDWFSKTEKLISRECNQFVVGISYTMPGSGYTQRMLKNQMLENGYLARTLIDFSDQLRSHPDFSKWVLQKYKVQGFCLTNMNPKPIEFTLPGFNKELIKL